MPKASLGVKVKQTGRVRPPNLDYGPLTQIGNAMVAAQKARWARSINAEGNRAKPLSKKAFFIKRKYKGNARPVRDNNMTGLMRQNFTLRKAINNVIRAENSTRLARAHAMGSQKYEEMIGFSGPDQTVVFRASQQQYGKWLQKAWVPLRG